MTIFRRNAPVYFLRPVNRTTSEERAECSRGWLGGWVSGRGGAAK